MDAAKLKPHQTMAISLHKGSIVLTPLDTYEAVTLDAMLLGVTPENVGGEFAWGGDVGAEVVHD
jgi:antitoxin component of MazEF toxin-antitoxin module